MPTVFVVGAFPESLVLFRGNLIRSLVEEGHTVYALSSPISEEFRARIEALGARHLAYPIDRTSLNPIKDLRTLRALKALIQEYQPDSVLTYTIKPVIYGGLACRALKVSRFVALITGLGYTFQGNSVKRKILTRLVSGLYRSALANARVVIFQNEDDRSEFLERGIVESSRTRTVAGSGVDLTHYRQEPISEGALTFLLIARLLKAKGIREYVEAARIVRSSGCYARFVLAGPTDSSPDAIQIQDVRRWECEGLIEYHEFQKDVRPLLKGCHVYVLPSYREGMPRTVLEAMATGRAIITTDVAGCRDTVIPGRNGFLVEAANARQLAEAMLSYSRDPDLVRLYGSEARAIAEARFDVEIVNSNMRAALLGTCQKNTDTPARH